MLQAERQKIILSLIDKQGVVYVPELAQKFEASISTIRRDLLELEKAGKISRTHGGAVSNTFRLSIEQPVNIKKDSYTSEKKRIALAAAELVKPGSTIILDSSTTVNLIAEQILNIPDITVITNDLWNINALSTSPNIELITVGGLLRKGSYTHIGYFCEKILEEIHADMAFLGVDAIDPRSGLMICAQEGTRQKKLMVDAATKSIVVCDHSKFAAKALVSFCDLKKISCVITGTEALVYEESITAMQNMGVKVKTV